MTSGMGLWTRGGRKGYGQVDGGFVAGCRDEKGVLEIASAEAINCGIMFYSAL